MGRGTRVTEHVVIAVWWELFVLILQASSYLINERITPPIHIPPGAGKTMHDRWGGELRPIAMTLRCVDVSSLSTRTPGRQHFGRQSAAHLLTAAFVVHG